jgi:hypothetical protein
MYKIIRVAHAAHNSINCTNTRRHRAVNSQHRCARSIARDHCESAAMHTVRIFGVTFQRQISPSPKAHAGGALRDLCAKFSTTRAPDVHNYVNLRVCATLGVCVRVAQ